MDAEGYSYVLPDYWILPLQPETLWTLEHDAYVARVVELVVESGARTVLEVGCGDGWNCAQLVKAGLTVTGIDWSQNASQHATHLVPQARFFCGDVTDSAFLSAFPEAFDAVVLIEVIEHIPPAEAAEALRRMRRCLKSCGTFVATTPSVNQVNQNPQHYRHFTPEVLTREIDAAGFRVERIEGYGDAAYAREFWKLTRWFDNRFYTIHPLRKWRFNSYRARCRGTPPERARGLIALARASSEVSPSA